MINAILIINQLQCSIFNEWQIIFNSMACIKLVRSEIMQLSYWIPFRIPLRSNPFFIRIKSTTYLICGLWYTT